MPSARSKQRPSRRAALGLIGLDDALDERMTHDILRIEKSECDTLNPAQHVDYMAQAGLLAVGKICLRHITRHDRLGAEPDAGKRHINLLDGSVLCLVEDDERIIERAAAHEGQWRDL